MDEGAPGADCLRSVGRHLREHGQRTRQRLEEFHRGVTTPAFSEPAAPPPCLETVGPTQLPRGGQVVGDDGGSCGPDCRLGPPAVLHGDEVLGKRPWCCLPKRGKRGCILLSPQRVVAPVGGEVILLSGICGDDGYLQVGQPLEWMLTPESVGTFIEVGNDDPGVMHRLAKISKADKRSPTYAIGVTSTKRSLITRGNLNPNDDVSLDKGQTWLSLSSPSEGTSRVTVLAPDSDCWDERKATATIYWVDARWQFPSAQQELAGTPVTLSTRVTRAEGSLPARGWRVRYETSDPSLALFAEGASEQGSEVIEATVDASGNATVELIPIRRSSGNFPSGTTTITMQVIRPAGQGDNMPDLTLATGQTFVTWSAPELALRAGAPAVAAYDVPTEVVANVQNPGDQPAENVRVSVAIPPGARVTQADSFARVTPGDVSWEIGTIPPRTQLDLFMTLAAQSPLRLQFEARADGGLYAEDTVAMDVFQPSLSLDVSVAEEQTVEVGTPVTFDIDVTNTGERPLVGVNLRAVGDEAMVHDETDARTIAMDKPDGPLQPGDTWATAVTFIPTESGRRCITVHATADGGQEADGRGCVTVINPVMPTPAVTATISGPQQLEVGARRIFRYRVVNTGQVPLNNVRVTATFDSRMQLEQATRGSDTSALGQYQVNWVIPEMPVGPAEGASVLLEGEFSGVASNPQATMILTVESAEGARASDSYDFEILPGAPAAQPEPPPTEMPPAGPAPRIPETPAPIPADPQAPPADAAETPPTAPDQLDGTLMLTLVDRDDPVRSGQPIRYSLSVRNISDEVDSMVALRFRLPEGVELIRAVQRLAPEADQYRREGDIVHLEEIRDLRPGEAVDFDLELICNQPKTLELVVEAQSRLSPEGVSVRQSTLVLP